MTIQEQIAVMQHYEDGGEIEYKPKHLKDGWCAAEKPPLWAFNSSDYRIKEKPKTKTVYEWMCRYKTSSAWDIEKALWTEEEASYYFSQLDYQKTGRSWEVPND